MANGIEAFSGVATCDGVTREEKDGVGLSISTTDSSSQLVEIGEAKAVGAVDEDGVGIRDIDAGLNDGGGEENVGFAFDEFIHDHLELIFFHLAVADDYFCRRNEFIETFGEFVDGFDSVVEEEDLAATVQLILDSLFDDALVVLINGGFDGVTIGGGGVDGGHVAHAHEGKVEGAGNGSGRESEDINLAEAFFEGFLVFDTKTLFFIDDDETEVLIADVA